MEHPATVERTDIQRLIALIVDVEDELVWWFKERFVMVEVIRVAEVTPVTRPVLMFDGFLLRRLVGGVRVQRSGRLRPGVGCGRRQARAEQPQRKDPPSRSEEMGHRAAGLAALRRRKVMTVTR
jgi:hypothetical protein